MHLFLRAYFWEFSNHFLLGAGIFTLFFFFGQSSRLLDLALLVSGQNTVIFLRSLSYLYWEYWISVSGFILPMALLFGITLTISRLQEDKELLAMASFGVSIHRFLALTAVLLGAVASYLIGPLLHQVIPKAKSALKMYAYEGTKSLKNFRIEPKTWADLTNAQIYAQEIHDNKMKNVVIYARRPRQENGSESGTILYKVTGEEASYDIVMASAAGQAPAPQLYLAIDRGHLEYPEQAKAGDTSICRFGRYENSIPLKIEAMPQPNLREYPTKDLKRKILELAQEEERRKDLSFAKTELSTRSTLALSPVSLAFVASLITLRLDRRSKSFGFGLSLALLAGYWTLLVISSTIGWPGLTNVAYLGVGFFVASLLK